MLKWLPWLPDCEGYPLCPLCPLNLQMEAEMLRELPRHFRNFLKGFHDFMRSTILIYFASLTSYLPRLSKTHLHLCPLSQPTAASDHPIQCLWKVSWANDVR